MSATITTSGDLPTFTIKANGSAIADVDKVLDITVVQHVNQVSRATITLIEDSGVEEEFAISASSTFVPGVSITIEAGYESKNSVIFTGIVTAQNLSVDNAVGSLIEVECHDEAVKMTVGRKTNTFSNSKDSDAIEQLISNYKGVSAAVAKTAIVHPELVQYYTSDWDFVLARAEVNGMIVTTLQNTVRVEAPDSNTSPVLTVTNGENMFNFQGSLNALTQLSGVKASAWDYATQGVVSGQASNTNAGPGNLSSQTLSEVVGLSEFELQTTTAELSDELTTWAKAQLVKSNYAKIRATTTVQGNSRVAPANYITVDGMGARFDGNHFVAGVSHKIAQGNWTTELTLGMSPEWFTAEPDVMVPPASGQLPGARGLYNATVKRITGDPNSAYRILIDIPLFDTSGEGLWARLSNIYSTSGAGAFFLPEVGDEVVVGFLNEDPRYPIILGSMYSETKKPFNALSPNENNSQKAIVTKGELKVLFDDENKVLTLKTPNNNTVVLNDHDQEMRMEDQNGNAIVMSSAGITIKSSKSINILADQQLDVKGSTGISLSSAGGDVKTNGLNVSMQADAQLSAKGQMTATLEGGMEAVVKGAMVMIN